MTAIRATEASLELLPRILPQLLQNLSIGRSHLALEQLQTAASGRRPQIVLITVVDDNEDTPIAAAIAIWPPGNRPRPTNHAPSGSAAATIVHAGPLGELDGSQWAAVAKTLAAKLDQVLRDRDVQFVQWATDPHCDNVKKWCSALGFQRIAELEYLSGSIESATSSASGRLALHPIDWQAAPETWNHFIDLVERTYIDTGDCPLLADFRTAKQTLDGYQESTAFAPELWYRVVATLADADSDVGCVILSNHSADSNADAAPNRGGVVELVYMGLVPEARSQGLGSQLMAMTVDQARSVGANQMIMAVDQSNTAARRVYHQSGFQPILVESVWAKSI